MSSDQDFAIGQLLQLISIDHDQSFFAQSLHFHVVVDDIAQTIQLIALLHLILCHFDSKLNSKAIA
jgi:hypothetical protein